MSGRLSDKLLGRALEIRGHVECTLVNGDVIRDLRFLDEEGDHDDLAILKAVHEFATEQRRMFEDIEDELADLVDDFESERKRGVAERRGR